MKRLTILGSTGSIGRSTLDVVAYHPELYQVDVLVAGDNFQLFVDQCKKFKPKFAVMANARHGGKLKDALSGIQTAVGEEAVLEAAAYETDWTMSAIVGAAGLKPTLRALQRGTTVALANKESIVCAGSVLMETASKYKSIILPVDSEHNAIFQLLAGHKQGIQKVILTASGGPFRTWESHAMRDVTVAQAVAHPKWSMGPKNSIDSATLMNKGLELIEASVLFNLTADQLEAVIHPQSLFHGFVIFSDGSHVGQFAATDMRLPIAHTLGWPERITTPVEPLSFVDALNSCTFEKPDLQKFPSLGLAFSALKQGKNAPLILNAANEVAVSAFIEGKIGFLDMYNIVVETMATMPSYSVDSLENVFACDAEARRVALDKIRR